MSIQSGLLKFPGADGQRLAARVVRPVGEPRGWALFAHCFSCVKDLRSAREISRALADAGIAVFRFDFTGLGESEGDFAETNFSSNLDDLVAAADHMRAELAAPEILIGHSLGGAAVLAVARRVPESKAFEAAKHPKSFVSLDDADHLLLSSPEDARYAGSVLASWASRFVDAPDEKVEAAEGEVVVRGEPTGFATRVLAGKHAFWADEPVRVGGTDQGPTPYGLLLAALGT